MSLATEISHEAAIQNKHLARLAGWIAAQIARQKTIRSVSACRKSELRDVGITTQDIMNLRYDNEKGALEQLRRSARARSGNW